MMPSRRRRQRLWAALRAAAAHSFSVVAPGAGLAAIVAFGAAVPSCVIEGDASHGPAPLGGGDPEMRTSSSWGEGAIAPLSAVAAEPDIRIRVTRNAREAKIASGGGGRIWLLADNSPRVESLNPVCTISRPDGKVWRIEWRDQRVELPGDAVFSLAGERTAQGGRELTLDGVTYAGRLRFVPRDKDNTDGFDVIELTSMEDYLPGVISRELYAGWRLETYRVQAVCARSYALHEHMRAISAGREFDVENTTRDQVYGGAKSSAVARQAVADTRGIVVAHGGEVLRTYYSSTCGGRAASARHTWPTTRGHEYNLALPIQGYDREWACQGSPLYRWSVTRDKAELIARIRAWGDNAGHPVRRLRSLEAVEVSRRSNTSRPREYELVDGRGKRYAIAAEYLRLACNYPTGDIARPDRRERVNSGDLEFLVGPSSVRIDGRGFGHGVGMCQYSAEGFAARGEGWQRIIRRFYPGADITRLWR